MRLGNAPYIAIFVGPLLCASIVPMDAAANPAQMEAGSPAKDFLREAAQSNLAEVKLGELAEKRAANNSVKEYGKMLSSDHSGANQKLETIAKENAMELPSGLNAEAERMYQKLAELSGAEFDRQFIDSMIKDHTKDIALFQKFADSGDSQQLKQYASNTLPTLKEHLGRAERISKDLQQMPQ